MRLDELLLVEDMPGGMTLPVNGKRRPIDAGFVLTWTETRPGDGEPYQRQGVVLCPAPEQETVWVMPDDPRDGDGCAVVVRGVVADDASSATRSVGGPGDYRSTAAWQSPRLLPRALLRADQYVSGTTSHTVTYLHARGDCPAPPPMPPVRVERGVPTQVDECYVYERWLHPATVRPFDRTGRYLPVCGVCLREGQPE